MIFMIIFALISVFMLGFILGSVTEPDVIQPRTIRHTDSEELERLQREYENFLSYDGSEQA